MACPERLLVGTELVNANFTEQGDVAGEAFWQQLARSSAALDL